MGNLKEFKDLILKYENITVEEINYILNKFDIPELEGISSEEILKELTGFGTRNTCTLCKAIKLTTVNTLPTNIDCFKCTWVEKTKFVCYEGCNKATYEKLEEIWFADDNFVQEIIDACHTRADYMRNIIQWFDEKI